MASWGDDEDASDDDADFGPATAAGATPIARQATTNATLGRRTRTEASFDVHPWELQQREGILRSTLAAEIARRCDRRVRGMGVTAARYSRSGILRSSSSCCSLPPATVAGVNAAFLPSRPREIATVDSNMYNIKFSDSGSLLIASSQDENIRVWDSAASNNSSTAWGRPRVIVAHEVGWAVSSIDVSPDESRLIYSSMTDTLHMVNLQGAREVHEPLNLNPDGMDNGWGRGFAIYRALFSASGNDIVAGTSSNTLVVYDLEMRRVGQTVLAHEDDINAVAFADTAARSNILLSGSDDHMIKVWDRRVMGMTATSTSSATSRARTRVGVPAGFLPGHAAGITSLAARGDGVYIVSNGKDQCAKLWDLRKMTSSEDFARLPAVRPHVQFDYRWQPYPGDAFPYKHPHDVSVMTYRGHAVLRTLIRAYFSPAASTGGSFIYTGSADGAAYVYDTLSGDVVAVLHPQRGVVRDVTWHPHRSMIATASFASGHRSNAAVHLWEYEERSAERMRAEMRERRQTGVIIRTSARRARAKAAKKGNFRPRSRTIAAHGSGAESADAVSRARASTMEGGDEEMYATAAAARVALNPDAPVAARTRSSARAAAHDAEAEMDGYDTSTDLEFIESGAYARACAEARAAAAVAAPPAPPPSRDGPTTAVQAFLARLFGATAAQAAGDEGEEEEEEEDVDDDEEYLDEDDA